jgi:hypothetical protein
MCFEKFKILETSSSNITKIIQKRKRKRTLLGIGIGDEVPSALDQNWLRMVMTMLLLKSLGKTSCEKTVCKTELVLENGQGCYLFG